MDLVVNHPLFLPVTIVFAMALFMLLTFLVVTLLGGEMRYKTDEERDAEGPHLN